MISLKNLDKAAVLAALYNASKPQGTGFLQYDPKPMTTEEAQLLLDTAPGQRFDYLKGRVMKIDLSEDELYTGGYNRDNGDNAAENVIATLEQSGDVNAPVLQIVHQANTMAAASDVEKRLGEHTRIEGSVCTLGLGDMREHLEPAIQKVKRN